MEDSIYGPSHDCFDADIMGGFRIPKDFSDCRGREYPETWYIGGLRIGSQYFGAFSIDKGVTWQRSKLSNLFGSASRGHVNGCIDRYRLVNIDYYINSEFEGATLLLGSDSGPLDFPFKSYDETTYLSYTNNVGGLRLRRSLDNGKSWNESILIDGATQSVTNAPATGAQTCCIHKGSNGLLYLGTAKAAQPTMTISGDNGATWNTFRLNPVSDPISSSVFSTAIWEKGGTYYYVCNTVFFPSTTFRYHYTSSDGFSWTKTVSGTPANAGTLPIGRVIPLPSGRLIAVGATYSTAIICVSDDDGISWLGNNASGTAIGHWIDAEYTIWRATLSGGVIQIYSSTDGSSWTLFNTLPDFGLGTITQASTFLSTDMLLQ